MARETKAERDARVSAEQQAALDLIIADYPVRMMKTLAEAQSTDFDIMVDAGGMTFRVIEQEDREYGKYYIHLHPTVWGEINNIEDLENSISWKKQKREHARLLVEQRNAALAKLTQEDRKILGL